MKITFTPCVCLTSIRKIVLIFSINIRWLIIFYLFHSWVPHTRLYNYTNNRSQDRCNSHSDMVKINTRRFLKISMKKISFTGCFCLTSIRKVVLIFQHSIQKRWLCFFFYLFHSWVPHTQLYNYRNNRSQGRCNSHSDMVKMNTRWFLKISMKKISLFYWMILSYDY